MQCERCGCKKNVNIVHGVDDDSGKLIMVYMCKECEMNKRVKKEEEYYSSTESSLSSGESTEEEYYYY